MNFEFYCFTVSENPVMSTVLSTVECKPYHHWFFRVLRILEHASARQTCFVAVFRVHFSLLVQTYAVTCWYWYECKHIRDGWVKMAGVALFHNSTYVAIDESLINTVSGELERPRLSRVALSVNQPWFLPGFTLEPNRLWSLCMLKLVEFYLFKCERDVLDVFAENKS